MSQMIGNRLAHYEIGSQLGAGEMGVVYEAKDSKLGRKVAIKLLHETTSKDSEKLARFEREAKLLAALNNPNIATIHAIERADDQTFLVLEYVPGDTLADRIAKGPMPVRECLHVARQIAEALEAAHDAGIIHRDLKPANIKITADGTVKVLDFGLAKARVAASSDTETLGMTADLSQPGIVIGTVSYMSPEQASGKPVDQRTDIWALGCVLYEALTRKKTFSGDSTTEVLAAILDRDPDWKALPASTPPAIASLLRRCLTKDPRNRLHHVADVRLEIDDALSGAAVDRSSSLTPQRDQRFRLAVITAAAAVVLAAAALPFALRNESHAAERLVEFSVELPPGARIIPSWDVHLTFSADSETLLYPVNFPPPYQLYTRALSVGQGRPLDIAKGLANPFVSPDGRWLTMLNLEKSELVKVPLKGGAYVPLAAVDQVFRGDWGRDGYIYWTSQMIGGIVRTPENGGNNEPVTELDGGKQERNHRYAKLLPGGKALMFTVAAGGIDSFDDARIDVIDLVTMKRKTIVQGGTYPRHARGHIVYARGGSLYAVPFNERELEVTGPPIKVRDGVLMSTNVGTAYYDVSARGDLAYAAGPAENGARTLHWVDRHGNSTPLPLPPRSYLNPRLSPDGKVLAIEVEGPNHDFFFYDFERTVMSRITNDGLSHAPIWSPDGKKIAYRSWKSGKMNLAWMPADRSGPAEDLVKLKAWQSAVSFSPDGKYLSFDQIEPDTGPDVWVLPLDGERQPRQFFKTKFSEGAGKFSPDGKWIVYCSTESGKPEIYVQPWPGPGPRIQISSEGGTDPVWRRDGKELFYRNGSKMMVVPISLAPEFRAGKPQLLWKAEYMHGLSSSCGFKGTTTTSYDVSPDGQRLLMIKDTDHNMYAGKIVVVLNWIEEFKRVSLAPNQVSSN